MIKRRFLCTFLALLMLVALLPALTGSARADTVKITSFGLGHNGTIALPQNGASFTNPTSKFGISGTEPAGLASELNIWTYWYNLDTGTRYDGSGTFTPAKWELFVNVSLRDPSKYEIAYENFLKEELVQIYLGGRDFEVCGCAPTGVLYRTQFIVEASESYVPIDNVPIDLRKPVVGEYPDYDPWPDYSAHCHSENNTHDSWKNDVLWYDKTASRFMTPDVDSFEAEHVYSVTIYLTPDEEYKFTDDVKGYLYDKFPMESTNRPSLNQAMFSYTFNVTSQPIESVKMTVTPPKVGAKPDYNVKFSDDQPYVHTEDFSNEYFQNGVVWLDETDDRRLKPNETFQAGHEYSVQMYLEADLLGYAITFYTTAVLNGKQMKMHSYHYKTGRICFSYLFPKLQDPKYDGTVMIDPNDVQLNGKTPYRVYDGKAQKPGVIVKDKNGKTVAASKYTVTYRNNTNPGTAYADVTMKDTGAVASVWFKIYLPSTKTTTVQNVQNGIQISWKKVDGAKGYVIYRRAWNLVDKGWTKFERWNNTTKTTWVDTKVYAGTRYQYGVKAYYADPMDNYNLGIVGPLKTTVRITTRVLNSVTPGSKKLTVKWSGSSVFTGYEVQAATDANFTKDVKTVTVKKAKTYQTAVSGLKAKTTYFVRVRSYHVFEGMTYYGQWSNVLSGKTK